MCTHTDYSWYEHFPAVNAQKGTFARWIFSKIDGNIYICWAYDAILYFMVTLISIIVVAGRHLIPLSTLRNHCNPQKCFCLRRSCHVCMKVMLFLRLRLGKMENVVPFLLRSRNSRYKCSENKKSFTGFAGLQGFRGFQIWQEDICFWGHLKSRVHRWGPWNLS